MRRIWGVMLVGFLTCFQVAATAPPEADPIQAKVDKALEAHKTEMEKLRTKAEAWFASRDKIARRDGNKKFVDQVREEERIFRTVGDLPVAARELRSTQAAAKEKLVRVYSAAVKEWTKAENDQAAAAAEAELQKIKAWRDPSLPRQEWVRDPKGVYRLVAKGTWDEAAPDGLTYRWHEVERTEDYVELVTWHKGKKYTLRLRADKVEYMVPPSTEFELHAKGKWGK